VIDGVAHDVQEGFQQRVEEGALETELAPLDHDADLAPQSLAGLPSGRDHAVGDGVERLQAQLGGLGVQAGDEAPAGPCGLRPGLFQEEVLGARGEGLQGSRGHARHPLRGPRWTVGGGLRCLGTDVEGLHPREGRERPRGDGERRHRRGSRSNGGRDRKKPCAGNDRSACDRPDQGNCHRTNA